MVRVARIFWGMAAVGVAGCTSLSPAYVRPVVDVPASWREQQGSQELGSQVARWWEGFGSEELDELVRKALVQNTDVKASVARIEQARGQLRVAGATLVPSVDATAGVGRTVTGVRGDSTGVNRSSAGVALGYELDVFGGNAAVREGARANLRAAGFDKDALALVTARDVCTTYFQLQGLRERAALAEVSLNNAEAVLNLLRTRLEVGTASALEVSQQEASVESARASLSSLRQSEKTTLDALAVLVGATPSTFTVSGTALVAMTVPEVGAGVPSALLENRPDIKAAEAGLQAANADIGAARSALFPKVTLSAGDTFAFDPARSTLDLAAGLTAPIFHGGALRGQLDVSKARQQELVATYQGTVLSAFREVEDALGQAKSAEERYASLLKAMMAADRAYQLTRVQLDVGTVDMPTLLQTQGIQLSASDALVQARVDRLGAAAGLAAAVGK